MGFYTELKGFNDVILPSFDVYKPSLGGNMLTGLFTSKVRIEILSTFFLNQDKDFYVRELTRITGADYKNINVELRNLENIGLLSSRKQGNLKYYSLNKEFLIYDELKSILIKTRGAVPVINNVLSNMKGIQFAFIYGSMATGEETAKSDIDLMVIGKVSLERLLNRLRKPEETLAREINTSLFDISEIKARISKHDSFITEVMNSPKFLIVGDEEKLQKISR